MTNPKKSDVQLEAELIDRTQKLLITKAVSGDFRLGIEKSFSDDTTKILKRVMRIISQKLRDEGYLELFAKQARLINMSFRTRRDRRRELNNVIRTQLIDLLDFVFNLSERRAFQRVHRLHTRMAYEYGAITALRSMGFAARSERLETFERDLVKKAPFEIEDVVEFGLTDEEIIYWLENGTLISGSTLGVTALESARATIANSMVLGELGIDEVAEMIATSLDTTDWQALRIARTETQVAFNSAMNDQYVRSKVQRRQWITVGDNRVRPAHTANEMAGWVEMHLPFPNGAMHPGEGADSINCRCSIQADLSDPDLIIEPWEGQPTILEPEVAAPPRAPRRDSTPKPKTPTTPRLIRPKAKPETRLPKDLVPDAEPPSIGGKMGTTADEINEQLRVIEELLEGPWGQDAAFKKKAKKRLANLRAKKKRIQGVRSVTADVIDETPEWMAADLDLSENFWIDDDEIKKTLDDTIESIFGTKKTPEEIASMAGAPDGSQVYIHGRLRDGVAELEVNIYDDLIESMRRTIKLDADGNVYIYNNVFKLVEEAKDTGRALQMFNRQVRAAKANDVKYLKCYGAGNFDEIDDWSGYYVWARYGYDADMPLTPDLRKYGNKVSDAMKTPAGRDEWKLLGEGRNYTFNLADNSYSVKTWDNYLVTRKRKDLLPKGHPLLDAPKPPKRAPKPKGLPRNYPHAIDELEFIKDLGGSTGAKLYRDPRTGKKYVLKKGANADHLRSEYLAEQLYRQSGAKVPNSFLYDVDGVPVKLSEFVEDAVDLRTLKATDPARYKKAVSKIENDFAADALLGNWDTVGMSMDNILVGADDVVWRVDVGGSLRYRAQGDLKDVFSTNVTELWSLSKEGNVSAQVFGNTKWSKKVTSMKKVVKKRAKILAKIDDPELRQIIASRIDSIEDTLFHTQRLVDAGWKKNDYMSDFMKHRVQMREAGVFDDMPEYLMDGDLLASSVESFGRRLMSDDGVKFFRETLSIRNRRYMLQNDLDIGLLNRWSSEQAASSWREYPKAHKMFIQKNRADASKGFWWKEGQYDGGRLTAAQYKKLMKKHPQWAETMAQHHAMNYEILNKVKFFNNDNAAGLCRIIRTENSGFLNDTLYAHRANKSFGQVAQMKRGYAESGSIFRDFYYQGDMITIQEVEHANIISTFITNKVDESEEVFYSMFAGDGENEFVCVFKPDTDMVTRPYRDLPDSYKGAHIRDEWKSGNLEGDIYFGSPE